MFGDAFSPYMIGALADSFKPLISPSSNLTMSTDPTTTLVNIPFLPGSGQQGMSYELTPEEYDLEFRALEYSLFTCCFFQVVNSESNSNIIMSIFPGIGSFLLLCHVLVCHE